MSIAESNRSRPPTWFTSTYSNGAGGECVECALTSSGVLVRDSKVANGPVIPVNAVAWASFLERRKW
ncbi:DUF397 domain-containing protein [Streptomyces sp. NPDC018693]|uniref:DUF397 domain-containing protein n=1 Tax=unclassified Streptomyces TaxID=2593676 RepID=UPI00378E54BD